jgi:hypothetical protein
MKSSNLNVGKSIEIETVDKQANSVTITWRVVCLYFFVLVSIFYYIYSQYLHDTKSETFVEQAIDLETVLLSFGSYKPENLNEQEDLAPEQILQFINQFDAQVSSQEVTASEDVVIYEIIEEKQQAIDIDKLLREATDLLNKDYLTSPADNNALERFQAVLAIDSKNSQALDGINKIVQRYVSLADKVIRKKETYKVPGLIQKANKVGGTYMDMKPILQKYSKYMDVSELFVGSESIDESDDQKDKKNNEILASRQQIIDADKRIASAAYRLIQEGDYDNSRKILEKFVNIFDFWGKSSDVLLELTLLEKKYTQAKTMVNTNDNLNRHLFAEKVARIFVAKKEYGEAIGLLEIHAPDINTYRNYFALLAGLHYFHGDHERSRSIYKELIELQHDNAKYWLGLAVVLSALDDSAATQAFAFAKEYATSDSLAKQYINQRLLVSTF